MQEIINPCIGLVDGSPSRASQLDSGKVYGGNIVSIVLKSTVDTSESVSISVSPINCSASWTSSGSICWVYVNNRYPSFQTFVFNHLLKSIESPTMEGSIVAFSVFCTVSDAIQFFHHDIISFFEGIYKSPAYLVQYRCYPSTFPSRKLFNFIGGKSPSEREGMRADILI